MDADAAIILSSLNIFKLNPLSLASTINTVPTGGNSAVSSSTEIIDTANHILYVLSGIVPDVGNRLQAINIANRNSPTILGSVPCTCGDANYRTALTSDNADLVCCNTSDSGISSAPNVMQIFQVTNPAAMVNIANYNLKTGFAISQEGPQNIIIVGRKLYVLSGNTVANPGLVQLGVYDLTNPLAVTQLGVVNIRNTADNNTGGVLNDVIGNFAILWVQEDSTGAQKIETWNISNPAAMVVGSSAALPTTRRTNRWSQVANGHLFGGSVNSALEPRFFGFNVSNPLAVSFDGATTPGTTKDNFSLRAAGLKMYAARQVGFNTFLDVFDATIPGNLALLGSLPYAANSRQQLHLDFGVNNMAQVACPDATVQIERVISRFGAVSLAASGAPPKQGVAIVLDPAGQKIKLSNVKFSANSTAGEWNNASGILQRCLIAIGKAQVGDIYSLVDPTVAVLQGRYYGEIFTATRNPDGFNFDPPLESDQAISIVFIAGNCAVNSGLIISLTANGCLEKVD